MRWLPFCLLFIAASCAAPPPANSARTRSVTMQPRAAILAPLTFDLRGHRVRADVTLDDSVAEPSAAVVHRQSDVRWIAANQVAFLDRFRSSGGGLAYCQAGEEVWFRVILQGAQPREQLAYKVESCMDGIVPADEAVRWEPPQIVAIHILDDGAGHERTDRFQINGGAIVRVGK